MALSVKRAKNHFVPARWLFVVCVNVFSLTLRTDKFMSMPLTRLLYEMPLCAMNMCVLIRSIFFSFTIVITAPDDIAINWTERKQQQKTVKITYFLSTKRTIPKLQHWFIELSSCRATIILLHDADKTALNCKLFVDISLYAHSTHSPFATEFYIPLLFHFVCSIIKW